MIVDLHTHSTASDGTEKPEAVIEAAAAAGVDVVALTDHDTTAGWDVAARAARRLGLIFVPGAEISANVHGIGVHLLSYLHDPQDAALRAETERTRADRLGRARRMVEAMSADVGIGWSDVLAQVGPDTTVGRPHLADALVSLGVVESRDEAFATVLHVSSPYYRWHYSPDATEVIRLVRAAGGVTVLAHPRAGRRGRVISRDDIAELAAAGLAGLEVDHRDNPEEDRRELRELARALGLLTTGASDYHGTGKQNRIAEFTTSPEVLEQIVELGTPERVVHP